MQHDQAEDDHAHDPFVATLDAETRRPSRHELTLSATSTASSPSSASAAPCSSSSTRVAEVVALELPVYTRDLHKAMALVGGVDTLEQSVRSQNQFLPIKLRPNEPSCKPVFADFCKTQSLLLKVKRKRVKSSCRTTDAAAATKTNTNDDTATRETSDAKSAAMDSPLQVELVGLIQEKYVCQGMADFQYFTSKRFFPQPDAPKQYPTIKSSIETELRPYLQVDNEASVEIIPQVFSKVDLPLRYEFRQRTGYQENRLAKPKPSTTILFCNFQDEGSIPEAPQTIECRKILRRSAVGSSDIGEEHVLKVLREKLEQKPIWLRFQMFRDLDVVEHRIATRLLRKLCYVFVDGPWRGCWVRMGYDPRTTKESAKYQVVELRNNRELIHSEVRLMTRRKRKHKNGGGNANTRAHGRVQKITHVQDEKCEQLAQPRRKDRFGRTSYWGATNKTKSSVSTSKTEVAGSEEDNNSVQGESSGSSSDEDNNVEMRTDEEEDAMSSSKKPIKKKIDAPDSKGKSSQDKRYELFGVQLMNATALFQLDDIDDEEVQQWLAQFDMESKPTLLGGWYPNCVFDVVREIIRLRIAALVNRPKHEIETRKKRIESLKKATFAELEDLRQKANDPNQDQDQDLDLVQDQDQNGESGTSKKKPKTSSRSSSKSPQRKSPVKKRPRGDDGEDNEEEEMTEEDFEEEEDDDELIDTAGEEEDSAEELDEDHHDPDAAPSQETTATQDNPSGPGKVAPKASDQQPDHSQWEGIEYSF